jgi:catechol 2,3-dioxygenase-like lactoylglutathione lyase family enzyme
MPIIKATDIAHVRLRSPDLDAAEQFLADLGMVRAAREKTALYMRGTDPDHHIHVTELGEPRFVGLAFHAASEDDLERVSRVEGASSIETIDEPGGGRRVRLTDPHGYRIDVVHGIATGAPLPVRRNVLNSGDERYRRTGECKRLLPGAPQVKRIGHAVIMTPRLPAAIAWYREMLGFVCSDEVYEGDPRNIIASFNRCDRGARHVDHHVFLCAKGERTGLHHVSFEVQDIDDVIMGHEHMASTGRYRHVWGVGRHQLGSQVFDYWSDPWGRVHEIWTDTDMLNVSHPPGLIPVEQFGSQWGEPQPRWFSEHASP